MDSKNKVILISVIVGVLVIGLVVGANVSGKAYSSQLSQLAPKTATEATTLRSSLDQTKYRFAVKPRVPDQPELGIGPRPEEFTGDLTNYANIIYQLVNQDLRDAHDANDVNTAVFEGASSVPTLRIRSDVANSLRVLADSSNWHYTPLSKNVLTNEISIVPEAGMGSMNLLYVLYVDGDNNQALAGIFRRSNLLNKEEIFGTSSYGKSNGLVTLGLSEEITNRGNYLYATLNDDDPAKDPQDNDDFATYWRIYGTSQSDHALWEVIRSMGTVQDAEEPRDVRYGEILHKNNWASIGTADYDMHNRFGTVIKDPETHCADDWAVFWTP